MLTAGELASMQATANTALPDVGTISIPAEGGTLDPDTGTWTPNPPTVIYSGPMRVRTPSAEEYTVLFGDREVTRTQYVATIPATGPDVPIGAVIQVTTSSDPFFASNPLRVTRVPSGSWLIIRRLGAEVIE